MKAIISNRIYLDNPGEAITKDIKKKLTYKFTKNGGGSKKSNFASIETILNYKLLPRGIISIPQCRTDLIPEGYEIVDKRVLYEVSYPQPVHQLFEEQVKVYNEINDTAIINAMVGWGKSYTALWLAKKFGQKTLVVTHSLTLRDQWIDDIQELFRKEPGIIGSGKIDYEDRFITVANTQTLVKHVEKVKKEFGLIILDECLDYETLVDTLEYGKKKIGVIVNQKLDCSVLSMSTESEVVEYKKVLSFYKNKQTECLKITHSGGGSFKCTDNHTIFTYSDGTIVPVKASSLIIGDSLLQTVENPVPNVALFNESYCVRSITKIEKSSLTGGSRYNIEVEDNHTYFANGILVSNCHHVPATSFSNILDGMHARYKLGLSGTLIRKDGKQIMFPDYFGTHVVKPPQSNTLNPIVKLVKTNVGLLPDVPWAERITKLVQDKDYQNFVAALAEGHMKMGHKVLVIADRVEFLKTISELVGPRMGLVTGTLGDRDLVKQQILSGDLDGICGSRQIFAEGTNIPPLSCVILTVPINNDSLLTQIVGRIQRLYPNKLQPLVLDLQFTGWADRKQNESRLGVYLREGWKIIAV